MLTARETMIAEAKQQEDADRAPRWAAPEPNVRRDSLDLVTDSRKTPASAVIAGIDPEMRMALREAARAAEEAAVQARTLAELLGDVLAALTDAEPGFAGTPLSHANAQP